jgi:hypothetical protein
MTAPLINVIFIGIVSALALETVWYWHRSTRGTWREWPAGRSLMYLLLIIGFGFGYGIINQFLGQYPARAFVGFGLYLLFIAALVIIRLTIRAEMRRGKNRLKAKLPTATGPVDVTVATTNEESPHD